MQLFELYEFWIENRIMIELATEDMLPSYTRLTTAAAQLELLSRRSAGNGQLTPNSLIGRRRCAWYRRVPIQRQHEQIRGTRCGGCTATSTSTSTTTATA
jgi:hypothetical protein